VTDNSMGRPVPHPELKKLVRFVGRWSMADDLVGGSGENIRGEATFRWLPGGLPSSSTSPSISSGCRSTVSKS
jgi:hypothetical protein